MFLAHFLPLFDYKLIFRMVWIFGIQNCLVVINLSNTFVFPDPEPAAIRILYGSSGIAARVDCVPVYFILYFIEVNQYFSFFVFVSSTDSTQHP